MDPIKTTLKSRTFFDNWDPKYVNINTPGINPIKETIKNADFFIFVNPALKLMTSLGKIDI